MSIGTRIKELRMSLNLTQEELAAKINVTKGAVANYENGISIPKTEIMYKLFSALKCDANYLYQDEMKIEETVSLNIKEKELIMAYRDMTAIHKEYIHQTFNIIKNAEAKVKNDNAEGLKISVAARNGKSDVIELTPDEVEIAKQKFPQYFK